MVRRTHIAVLLVAACLGGCGGYATFGPGSTGTLSSGASATSEAAAPANSADQRLGATPDMMLAGAAQGADSAAQPSVKSVALTGTGDFAAQPALVASPVEPRGRAYLFRGVAGLIYSRGMDSLADRIRHAGLAASVQTYLTWRNVAGQVIEDYRQDPAPVVLIGHSMGGDAALSIAEALNAENIPVSLLVTLDPSRIADDVPSNVERYINIYQSSNIMGGGNVVQSSRFHGHYASYNLKDHIEIIHINIEKSERIQEQLVSKIVELSTTPAATQGEAVPLRLEVPADAAIELWDSGLPVSAQAGDTLKSLAATYHVPFWSLAEINAALARAPLAEGQQVVIPRHLVPMAAPSTITSYAPSGR
jgi:fermentation-respiration switch protein FrsA (DUF1100 family)